MDVTTRMMQGEMGMAQSVIHLTQSRFYSPVFNAAVFDGPIRIYFAQHQEGMALKVYFQLQQYLKDTYSELRKSFRQNGQTVFLMLYPNTESFGECFASDCANVMTERLAEDFVVGVRPQTSDDYTQVFETIKAILQAEPVESASPAVRATL